MSLKKVRFLPAGPKTAYGHKNMKNVRVLGSAKK
jgi:hypothetical protein